VAKAAADEPIGQIDPGYSADGYSPPISIAINFDACHWPTIDKGGEIVRRFLAASIVVAVRIAAKLIASGASIPVRRMR
jgi:hypothetical protein